MKRGLIVMLVLAMVLLAGAPCFAENGLHKLGRGLINAGTGWCEYPKQIVEVSKEQNVAVGASWGQIKGLGMSAYRTGVGLYDTISFPIPPYDKLLIEPEFVFEF